MAFASPTVWCDGIHTTTRCDAIVYLWFDSGKGDKACYVVALYWQMMQSPGNN